MRSYNYQPNFNVKVFLTTNGSLIDRFSARDITESLGEKQNSYRYKTIEHDNFIFDAELSFCDHYKNGDGTVTFLFKETNGERYFEMKFADFMHLLKLKHVPIYPGTTWIGRWAFKQANGHTGIYYIPSEIEIKDPVVKKTKA